MQKIIAFCGLNCKNCRAYIATQENSNQKRKEVAEAWSTPNYPLKPEDINCDGCLLIKNGRTISFMNACTIRQCGLEKQVENCAHCADYPCPKLAPSHQRSPEAKQTLNNVHKQLKY
ncbi:MAG: DUF3795 domain-containing protein [Candidatus Bathyarchaeota archaeon]|nr:DUF3795 domain-containing protein [Candidatus Bathyarchaeota archaeon]